MKHLNYFQVRNFKRFKKLELNDLKQFNLIVGDNGTGKTSLLEALLFDPSSLQNTVSKFSSASLFRFKQYDFTKANFLTELFLNNIEKAEIDFEYNFVNTNSVKIQKLVIKKFENFTDIEKGALRSVWELEKQNYQKELATWVNVAGKTEVSFLESFGSPLLATYLNYIPFHLGYEYDLVTFFSENIQSSKGIKDFFISQIKRVFPLIENIEISQKPEYGGNAALIVWLKGEDNSILLSQLGEGFIKMFRILVEIFTSKDSILLIDEIDAGIHYSRFKEFWITIIQMAEFNNVQLFATTHSLECLKFFSNSFTDEKISNLKVKATILSLIEGVDKQIYSNPYSFEQFEYSLNEGLEIRGGK